MRFLIAMSMLTLTALAPAIAGAGTRDPRVNTRQHAQHERIEQGVRSGELTRREARNAREDQRDIRQLERAYKSDGKLTAAERRDLNHEQNQASREIYRNKHDAQVRAPAAVRDPEINARQANQAARIAQGVKSGELTPSEAKVLRDDSRDIRNLERQDKSDHVLTEQERRELNQRLDQNSAEIHQEKHDEDHR